MAQDLAERIRLILHETGMTQADLARGLGMTRGAVNSWTQGRAGMYAETAFAVADLTGYQARWIATGQGPKKLVRNDAKDAVLLQKFLEHIQHLDPATRALVNIALTKEGDGVLNKPPSEGSPVEPVINTRNGGKTWKR